VDVGVGFADRQTNFILKTKEQDTRLTLHEHDNDDNKVKRGYCKFRWQPVKEKKENKSPVKPLQETHKMKLN
jgi:hypothetical protein